MVTLTKANPLTGRPNPYRTRWAQVDGVVVKAESDSLDGLWGVEVDHECLGEYMEQAQRASRAHLPGETRDRLMRQINGLDGLDDFHLHGDALVAKMQASPVGRSHRFAYRLYGRGRTAGSDSVAAMVEEITTGPDWPEIRDAWLAVKAAIDGAVAEAEAEAAKIRDLVEAFKTIEASR